MKIPGRYVQRPVLGTLSLSAICSDTVAGVPLGGSDYCSIRDYYGTLDASASAAYNATAHDAEATLFNGSDAYAEFSTIMLVDITGGSGSGFFVPCLYAQQSGWGVGTASFGSVAVSNTPVGGICGNTYPPTAPPVSDRIPFVFGVPQIDNLDVFARVFDPNESSPPASGSAGAYLSGFYVFDASGNFLPSATVATQDLVPEPGTALSVFCVLAAVLIAHRRLSVTWRHLPHPFVKSA
jgi:hypothetical protein